MRGTHESFVDFGWWKGIIPAYAGNTTRCQSCPPVIRDHPRVCGEHQLKANILNTYPGSSPRMRGTLVMCMKCGMLLGIIPAYAGNTSSCSPPHPCGRDHPRVCGEHYAKATENKVRSGSSPRMRGTRMSVTFSALYCGIIPAYAGNTGFLWETMWLDGDHPRVCGEHICANSTVIHSAGSSPRMRGTPNESIGVIPKIGIIPAYAGNTKLTFSRLCATRDHPRVCGEHIFLVSAFILFRGSSPRMRGTHVPNTIIQVLAGIIPAYAGNT